MGHRSRIANFPGRIAAGAFILSAGLDKLQADQEGAEGVHGMAKGTYPFLDAVPAERFAKALATGEVALGAGLLVPVVSDRTAGLGLAAFAGGLLGLYARTPGLRRDGSIRPSREGTAIAKDVWLLGIGLGLVADSFAHRHHRDRRHRRERAAGQ